MGISILAPTRGATTPWLARKKLERHFNPRSREGSDDEYEQYTLFSVAFQSTLPRGERQPYRKYRNVAERFQSTLPRGERREHTTQAQAEVHFNPRSREGSDINDANGSEGVSISIHAPARGATKGSRFQSFRKFISIHAPARGATQSIPQPHLSLQFQSTLPRGERHIPLMPTAQVPNFNPRSREGSDRRAKIRYAKAHISIHAPARGATATLPI